MAIKKGYIPHNKGIQIERIDFERKNYFRPDRELLNSISEPDDDGLVQVQDTVGQDVNVSFLRPLSTPPSVLESHQIRGSPGAEFETNRIFHPGKVQELCNSAFRCHSIHKPACQGELHWDADGEIQRGLGWRERLKCSICDYVLSRHNLYSEVQSAKPGAKTVGLNIGIQVGLSHTSISNSGLDALLLAMNIPSPSFSSMQNSANKVGDRIEAENREDLEKIRSFVKEGNKARGLPDSSPISVSTDATYNNCPCSGKTPYQAGTQVTQVVTEKSTNQQFIIDINNKSKLC